jgi:dTDP-4-amino-4,6-dideoxygalactose transaminase
MRDLARKNGLPLIEDCALALFSADGDLPLGVTGDLAVFCLYKVLAVPDGGVMVSNGPHPGTARQPGASVQSRGASAAGDPLLRPPLASTIASVTSSMLRSVALRGRRPGRALRALVLGLGKRALSASKGKPVLAGTQHFNRDHAHLGISRLTEHLLRAQDVPTIVARRRRNYLFLLERLRALEAPLFEDLPRGVVPLCYPLLVDDNRRVMEQLVARGIEAVDFWREGHPSCATSGFPDVARLRASVLEIPCHQDLTLETLAAIVDAIRDVLGRQAGRLRVRAARASSQSSASVPMASS